MANPSRLQKIGYTVCIFGVYLISFLATMIVHLLAENTRTLQRLRQRAQRHLEILTLIPTPNRRLRE